MMIKCKVCGCEFTPVIDKHYVSKDNDKTGLNTVFSKEEVNLYDTFDCPACGCQIIAQERKRAYIPCVISEDMEEEENE